MTNESESLNLQRVLEEDIYSRFICAEENEKGELCNLGFKNTDSFNFAFDVMDVLGKKCGNLPALLNVTEAGAESRLTFGELMNLTNKAANYFESLGIKRGDKVMLVLKRHYQFWVSLLALHKIGAITVPATSQLRERDFEHRFELGEISAVLCTSEDNVPQKVDATPNTKNRIKVKVIVNGEREGWNSFNEEYTSFSDEYERKPDSPCGEELMLMFFTSGTTGYPKIVSHDYKYPFGHFITAKYWHNIKPGGLHLTVSDTGWGKAFWGKLYGQWLCGATVFVYEFDRFNALSMLPILQKYGITTFCAPPTVYRMLIKEDISKYDLSSIYHATTAGEALNPEVFKKFKKATGLDIMEGYGQTETTLIIGNLTGMEPRIGSMGKAVPSYKIGLLNSDNEECAAGETGEIVIYDTDERPCGLFCGYHDNEELTRDAWHDGAYHTGDLATRDKDGYFWYVGRTDDIIKSSGYKIAPFEVENIIMELPFVLECAISGEPDEIRGQILKASVVLTKGTEPSDDLKRKIQTYVKEKTAPYKYPRQVVFLEELPKTISGKVIRHKL